MRSKCFLIILFVQFSISSWAQDGKQYQAFLDDVVKGYKELSKGPIENAYEVLINTAAFTFSPENTLFINALNEMEAGTKIDAELLIDSLFNKTFRHLRNKELWTSAEEIYKTKKNVFDAYYRSLCPCLTKGLKGTDRMEKVLSVQETCITRLIQDSVFLRSLRLKAGRISMEELNELQSYFVLYMYQNCDIFNTTFNQSILSGTVTGRYFSALSQHKETEVIQVMRMYAQNELDSLIAIFPEFKKYIPQLTLGANKINDVAIQPSLPAYNRFGNNNEATVAIALYKGKAMVGKIVFNYASQSINAPINGMSVMLDEPRVETEAGLKQN